MNVLFGSLPDHVVGSMLGMSRASIARRRQILGIPAHQRQWRTTWAQAVLMGWLVEQVEPVTTEQVAAVVSRSGRTARAWLDLLESQGLVLEVGTERRRMWETA